MGKNREEEAVEMLSQARSSPLLIESHLRNFLIPRPSSPSTPSNVFYKFRVVLIHSTTLSSCFSIQAPIIIIIVVIFNLDPLSLDSTLSFTIQKGLFATDQILFQLLSFNQKQGSKTNLESNSRNSTLQALKRCRKGR